MGYTNQQFNGNNKLVPLRTLSEIKAIRRAGKVVAEVLDGLTERIKPGVTTGELDSWAEEWIRGQGALPAFKGYHGFPKALCTSVNEAVVHGIPGSLKLKNGDIVSIDVGTKLNGWCGDAARTYAVGKVDDESERLMRVTKEALQMALAQAKVGNHLSDIGHAIQQHVEAAGFSVVRDYVGHGIGKELHEDPQVPNFGEPHQGILLKAGMILAIEPMVNAGGFQVHLLDDNWTVVAQDKSRSAHFEHTVAILDSGLEVLTK